MPPDPFHADDDPLDGVANLFDLGVVFSLGFVLALFGMTRAREPIAAADRAVPERRQASPSFRASGEEGGGQGTRVGVAYRLPDGQIVFVPDGDGTER